MEGSFGYGWRLVDGGETDISMPERALVLVVVYLRCILVASYYGHSFFCNLMRINYLLKYCCNGSNNYILLNVSKWSNIWCYL